MTPMRLTSGTNIEPSPSSRRFRSPSLPEARPLMSEGVSAASSGRRSASTVARPRRTNVIMFVPQCRSWCVRIEGSVPVFSSDASKPMPLFTTPLHGSRPPCAVNPAGRVGAAGAIAATFALGSNRGDRSTSPIHALSSTSHPGGCTAHQNRRSDRRPP